MFHKLCKTNFGANDCSAQEARIYLEWPGDVTLMLSSVTLDLVIESSREQLSSSGSILKRPESRNSRKRASSCEQQI